MKKTKSKFLYATKLQFYIMLVSDFFTVAILAYATLFDSEPLPFFVFALTFLMMATITWAIYQSYKGKLPLLRIEE